MKRRRQPPAASGDIVAKPNIRYVYYPIFRDTVIVARRTGGGRLTFIEVTAGRYVKTLSRATVVELFTASALLKYQPFNRVQNPEFTELLFKPKKPKR